MASKLVVTAVVGGLPVRVGHGATKLRQSPEGGALSACFRGVRGGAALRGALGPGAAAPTAGTAGCWQLVASAPQPSACASRALTMQSLSALGCFERRTLSSILLYNDEKMFLCSEHTVFQALIYFPSIT